MDQNYATPCTQKNTIDSCITNPDKWLFLTDERISSNSPVRKIQIWALLGQLVGKCLESVEKCGLFCRTKARLGSSAAQLDIYLRYLVAK